MILRLFDAFCGMALTMDFDKFINAFADLPPRTNQPRIEDIDILGIPVTFIPQYIVGCSLSGISRRIYSIDAVQVHGDLFTASIPLVSFDPGFHILLKFISTRYRYGEINAYSIRESALIYACLSCGLITDQDDLFNVRNKVVDDYYDDIDDLIFNSGIDIIESSKFVEELDCASIVASNLPVRKNNRYYYPILPWDLYDDGRFKLCAWGFIS